MTGFSPIGANLVIIHRYPGEDNFLSRHSATHEPQSEITTRIHGYNFFLFDNKPDTICGIEKKCFLMLILSKTPFF